MRIFSGSLNTETNTFGPLPTALDAFRERVYFPAGQHPDRMLHCAGPLWAARLRGATQGWDLVEGLVASAQPSGTTTRHAYETLRDELLQNLRLALPVDMVLLGLHGAMVADGYDDCEGDLLGRIRDIVGADVTIGATLDPHSALTEAMVSSANVLIAYKEYPHTDALERALELVDLCAARVEGRCRPVAAVVDCQMIVTAIHTSRQPARGFVDRLQSLEGRDGVLSISLIHGFPWHDVPGMGTKVLVYCDGDQTQADALARRVADELIGMRVAFSSRYPQIDAALDAAVAFDGKPVVLADTADNPGGGAAGDSTFIARRMIERGIRDAIIGPLWDPGAVRIAFDAGVGARLPMRIGGKIGPRSGEPLDLDVTVSALFPDMIMTGLSNTQTRLGDCAFVQANGIGFVLVSLRCQATDIDLFTQLGCDLAAKKIVVVKSSQHFYASFSTIAAKTIYVDSPGTLAYDLRTIPYKKIPRPKWPLDNTEANSEICK
jgi:microcystin degradation protein MlrC